MLDHGREDLFSISNNVGKDYQALSNLAKPRLLIMAEARHPLRRMNQNKSISSFSLVPSAFIRFNAIFFVLSSTRFSHADHLHSDYRKTK